MVFFRVSFYPEHFLIGYLYEPIWWWYSPTYLLNFSPRAEVTLKSIIYNSSSTKFSLVNLFSRESFLECFHNMLSSLRYLSTPKLTLIYLPLHFLSECQPLSWRWKYCLYFLDMCSTPKLILIFYLNLSSTPESTLSLFSQPPELIHSRSSSQCCIYFLNPELICSRPPESMLSLFSQSRSWFVLDPRVDVVFIFSTLSWFKLDPLNCCCLYFLNPRVDLYSTPKSVSSLFYEP